MRNIKVNFERISSGLWSAHVTAEHEDGGTISRDVDLSPANNAITPVMWAFLRFAEALNEMQSDFDREDRKE